MLIEKLLHTAITSTIAIVALFILARIMGKKQMAQLSFFDYVIGISIGSIASEYAVVRDIHLVEGLTALIVFTLFCLALSFVSMKSLKGRKILDGTPLILIENGKIIEPQLRKAKLTVNDLLEECRQKNMFDISEIEFAILETSGRLSVLPRSQNQPLTPKDMQIPTMYKGLCTNVIIDGKIINEHLYTISLTPEWLHAELTRQGIDDPADVLLAYVSSSGVLCVHRQAPITPA